MSNWENSSLQCLLYLSSFHFRLRHAAAQQIDVLKMYRFKGLKGDEELKDSKEKSELKGLKFHSKALAISAALSVNIVHFAPLSLHTNRQIRDAWPSF